MKLNLFLKLQFNIALTCIIYLMSVNLHAQEDDRLPKQSSKPVSDVTSRIRVKEIVEPSAEYRFSTFGREDPFTPPSIEPDDQGGIVSPLQTAMSPLQTDLKDLSVKGVWEIEGGKWRALIEVKDGPSVIADLGDSIGPSGKIVAIRQSGIVARQYKIRDDGIREYEDKILAFESSGGKESKGTLQANDPRRIQKPNRDTKNIKDFIDKVQRGSAMSAQ